jgi:hypothetical protein
MSVKHDAPLLTQSAKALVQALTSTPSIGDDVRHVRALTVLANQLDPKEAAELASTLGRALKDTQDPRLLRFGGRALWALAAQINPKDAMPFITQAVHILAQDLKAFPGDRYVLAEALSAAVTRLDPEDAMTTLVNALQDADDEHAVMAELAKGLSAVAARMDQKEAAQAVVSVPQALRNPRATTQAAAALSAMLPALVSAEVPPRTASAATAATFPNGFCNPLCALAVLIPAEEPLPCRLSTQQLVELLKMPTCTGEARRVVLDHLGNRYHRPFADVWEFVRYAQEQHPGLDFTTPPQRPERVTNMTTNL